MLKAKKIIICFLGACLVACSGFTAFAQTTHNYSYPFSKPSSGSNFGYIEIEFNQQTALFYYVYTLDPVNSNNEYVGGACQITFRYLPSQGFVRFEPDSASSGNVHIWAYFIDYYGNVVPFTNLGTDLPKYRFPYTPTGYHAYGCKVVGLTSQSSFTINYGTDNTVLEKLDLIYQSINSLGSISNDITSNADKNASNIQSNDDKNTQSIIDNQNQLAEQEKTETQNSGNNSVNDVSSSVPDKSAGMLSALQSLSNAVSYTGTTAKWTFPQMYIPAISGVTDRINLNPEMEIDFSYWINQIPQDIRTVISALATIGLVVFAFKELYGLISYVLTLKGGGNNE